MTATNILPAHWKVLRILGWGAAAFIMLAPLVAMRFSTEVDWDATDFLFMGGLLAICGAAEEVMLRLVRHETARVMATGVILGVFLLVWAGAVRGVI